MAAAIRPARATDAGALAAIENAAFSTDRLSERSFLRLILSASASVLAAADGDTVVGYLVLLFRSGSSKARLYSIAAAPERAGAGLGRTLLEAAEAEAARRGASTLRLEVRAGNFRAIRLYELNGYRRFGRLEGYYADGEAAFRLEKELKRAAGAGCGSPVAPLRNRAVEDGVDGFEKGVGGRRKSAAGTAVAGNRPCAAAAMTGKRRRR